MLKVRGEKMALVFELSSNLAMFRKGYTTTSMVSYPFITPTAVAGIVSAIVGIENGADVEADCSIFWNELKGTQIAISICRPLKWYSTAVNLIKFKGPSGDMREHIQPKHQFIKDPCYRVFIRGGKLYDQLKKKLEAGECVYTPYLGVAYCLADVKYLGEFPEEEINQLPVEINSIISVAEGMTVDIRKSGSVFREIVPMELDAGRGFIASVPVLYSGNPDSGSIVIKEKGSLEISRVGSDNVAWFSQWK